MKNIIAVLVFVLLAVGQVFAQNNLATVDTEYILSNIPAYESSQNQLDEMSKKWEKEVQDKRAMVKKLYEDFQNNYVLLSEEMRKKKEAEIVAAETAVRDLQKKYFGPEGELFKKREELVKPIQDNVYAAIKEIAEEGSFDLIFDTASSGVSILYANPEIDLSDNVLEKLGYGSNK